MSEETIKFPPGYFEGLGWLATSIYAHPTDCKNCRHRAYLHDDNGCNERPKEPCTCTKYVN